MLLLLLSAFLLIFLNNQPLTSLMGEPVQHGFGQRYSPVQHGTCAFTLLLQTTNLARAAGGSWVRLESLVVADSPNRYGGTSSAPAQRGNLSSPLVGLVGLLLLSHRVAHWVVQLALLVDCFVACYSWDYAWSPMGALSEEREVRVGVCLFSVGISYMYIVYSMRAWPMPLSLSPLPLIWILRSGGSPLTCTMDSNLAGGLRSGGSAQAAGCSLFLLVLALMLSLAQRVCGLRSGGFTHAKACILVLPALH